MRAVTFLNGRVKLFPKTIRGQHGTDNIRNAVHCTDLPTDGVNECEYFFNVLQM